MAKELNVDVSTVGMRVGSVGPEPVVYVQFFDILPDTEEEQRYTIRMSLYQLRILAETYPAIKEDFDQWAAFDSQFDDRPEGQDGKLT